MDDTVDLNAYISVPTVEEQPLLVRNEALFQALLEPAVEAIGQAKAQHDVLEEYYVRHMDYERVNDILQKTLKRIEPLLK